MLISDDNLYKENFIGFVQKTYPHILEVSLKNHGIHKNLEEYACILLDGNDQVHHYNHDNMFPLHDMKTWPVSRIIKHILKGEETQFIHGLEIKREKIIGFYSPLGGCGKTTLATALSCYLGHYEKTLYLNVEPIACNPYLYGQNDTYNLSDLLYFIEENRGNVTYLIEKVVCQLPYLQVFFFQPHNTPEDLQDISHVWLELLGALTEHFDHVIIDFPTENTTVKECLLPYCGHMVHVKEDSFIGEYKEKVIGKPDIQGEISWFNKLNEGKNHRGIPYYTDLSMVRSVSQLTKHPIMDHIHELYKSIREEGAHV